MTPKVFRMMLFGVICLPLYKNQKLSSPQAKPAATYFEGKVYSK
jgi:hypothetical protein